MGTRFLATRESDFAELWKNGVVKAGDRGTLIARGFVGPARWIKTPVTEKHAENSLKMSPGVFLGKPDDYTTIPYELIISEIEGINAAYSGDESKAMMAAGECAQRIDNLPPVQELVDLVVKDAADIISTLPKRVLV